MAGERVTRGDLLHWYKPGYAHFVTYRLVDSIPAKWLEERRARREKALLQKPAEGRSPRQHRANVHKRFFAEYDEFIDRNVRQQWLANPAVAEAIRENLYHHHGAKYELIAWCVMPNHVHVLLQPFEHTEQLAASPEEANAMSDEISDSGSPLSAIMHSLKSFTANRCNSVLSRDGPFWQKESYDHWVRDLDELERNVAYIMANPVKAGLCEAATEWRFSSAYDRFQRDESRCGTVGWLRDDWRR